MVVARKNKNVRMRRTETLRVASMRLANARESGGDISEFQKTVQEAQADRLLAFSDCLDEQGGELPPQPVAGGRDVGPLDAALRQRGGRVVMTESSTGKAESARRLTSLRVTGRCARVLGRRP